VRPEDASELNLKAETFVHYTFQKSNQQLMVTDIQGINYSCCSGHVYICSGTPVGSSLSFCFLTL
jgi:hypothetical protein